MARGGQQQKRAVPERRCIVTGESRPKKGLVRFVVDPSGVIVPDILEKLPGRGIWVMADAAMVVRAVEKGLFSRAARAPAKPPEGLARLVEKQLAKHVLDLVAMSRKTGNAVAGFEKVKRWLAEGRARVLLQASDGSERGKGKLWTPEGGRFFGMLSSAELGLAFGRESVIHGALASGGLTTRVVEEATRLAGFRGNDGGKAAGKV